MILGVPGPLWVSRAGGWTLLTSAWSPKGLFLTLGWGIGWA